MTHVQFIELVRLLRHYQKAELERPTTTNWLKKKQLEKEVDDEIERFKKNYQNKIPKQTTLHDLFEKSQKETNES